MNGHANRTETDTPGPDRHEALLDRIERMTELKLIVLAFEVLPLLVAPSSRT